MTRANDFTTSILTRISLADESIHVCHKGYISLFPFLLGLLPASSPHLGAVLDILRDPEQLWSPYGIRSLSTQEPLFGQGENYWRGPIWIQMNYMALSVLYKVRPAPIVPASDPHLRRLSRPTPKKQGLSKSAPPRSTPSCARTSLTIPSRYVHLIGGLHALMLTAACSSQEYERTGAVWEQYDALTGKGRRR